MSVNVKLLVLVAALGGGFYAVSQAQPPVQNKDGAAAADSTAVRQVSFRDRLNYSVGSVGSAVVGTSVRRSVEDTQQSLKDMSKAIKATSGYDGIRARDLSRKITTMDSLAIDNLHMGHPIKAVRQTMEAKNLLNAVRFAIKQSNP
jgi:hypothetical protein